MYGYATNEVVGRNIDDLMAETGLARDDILDTLVAMRLVRMQSLDQIVDDPMHQSDNSPDASIVLSEPSGP